jgi:hypothetical protein
LHPKAQWSFRYVFHGAGLCCLFWIFVRRKRWRLGRELDVEATDAVDPLHVRHVVHVRQQRRGTQSTRGKAQVIKRQPRPAREHGHGERIDGVAFAPDV